MKIFTEPIASLTWQDICQFCELSLPESISVDYKRELPAEIERTIAAMANSNGGLIAIGVDEDRNTTRPISPPCGLAPERGLVEKITNVCISNISPPIVPDIGVVKDDNTGKVVVIVRVQQSHQAPHAISKSTRVYLRRGSVNSPEELASLDELEWLKGGRLRSVEFRDFLIRQAEWRAIQFLRGVSTPPSVINDVAGRTIPYLTISLCPTFPSDPFVEPPELQGILSQIHVRDYYNTDTFFPLGGLNGTIVQDGFVIEASRIDDDWTYYTELNTYGLIYFRQNILTGETEQSGTRLKVIRASEIFCRLEEVYDSGTKYLGRLGFQGEFQFRMLLQNVLGHPLGQYVFGGRGTQLSHCPDNDVSYEIVVSTFLADERKGAAILAAAKKLAWAFNWNIDSELLDDYFLKEKGKKVVSFAAR